MACIYCNIIIFSPQPDVTFSGIEAAIIPLFRQVLHQKVMGDLDAADHALGCGA